MINVVGSEACKPPTDMTGESTPSWGDAKAGSRILASVYAASREVNRRPSWNVTPSRIRKVQCMASPETSQSCARSGTALPASSNRTSRLYSAPRYS